jgi:uncharacterized protein (UPF0297 family)
MDALIQYLSPENIHLDHLLLDPNNARFVTPGYEFVPDGEIDTKFHQDRASSNLIDHYGADKLRQNMEVNGYLPIDRIIVRKISSDPRYVVLEGNRRIAAAKKLRRAIDAGATVENGVSDSLKVIPALIYTGDDSSAAWLFQGLRHISGITDWSAYHKARLLVEQMQKEDLSISEVAKRFGLSPHGAGQWARGYYAFNQAKEETDYGQEIDEQVYPYFQELFGRSSIAMKEWLAWNDKDKIFENQSNLNEFLSWFYPREDANEGHPDEEFKKGDWDKRRISRRDDIRQLSDLIVNNGKAFQRFRQGDSVESAYSQHLTGC